MSMFQKIKSWLHLRRWERRHGKIQQVTVLTKPVTCFQRELEFSLPSGFRIYGYTDNALYLESPYLHITVLRVPFHRHLHKLTVRDLVMYFRRALPVLSMPELTRSYLRYSPMLTAEWDTRTADLRTDRAALCMIAVQQTVYVFLMTGNKKAVSGNAAVILASVQVHPERVEARMKAECSKRDTHID